MKKINEKQKANRAAPPFRSSSAATYGKKNRLKTPNFAVFYPQIPSPHPGLSVRPRKVRLRTAPLRVKPEAAGRCSATPQNPAARTGGGGGNAGRVLSPFPSLHFPFFSRFFPFFPVFFPFFRSSPPPFCSPDRSSALFGRRKWSERRPPDTASSDWSRKEEGVGPMFGSLLVIGYRSGKGVGLSSSRSSLVSRRRGRDHAPCFQISLVENGRWAVRDRPPNLIG